MLHRLWAFCLLSAILFVSASAQANWATLMASAPAPIRSITRRSDGLLIGPRSSGHTIEVWASGNGGTSWSRKGSVVSSTSVDFGDPMMLSIANTRTIFCACREHTSDTSGQNYRVTVYRSDDDGNTWTFDSVVVGPVTNQFIGAPFLFVAPNGDLQCYYDSEVLAAAQGHPGFQWIAMQGRAGMSGLWNKYGTVVVSRENNPSVLCRDGLSTVTRIGPNRLLCVNEGVEPTTRNGNNANVIYAIESWDGGMTWDYAHRQMAYASPIDAASGQRFNAYCPSAIRVGGGPVGVAFCTDEDFPGPPVPSSTPVGQRKTHIKYLQTTDTFEHWGTVSTLWQAGSQAYSPGLFERSSNDVICTLDNFSGNQSVMNGPVHNVSGVITLQQCVHADGNSLTFAFRPTNGSLPFTRSALLNADGSFHLPDIPSKNYLVAIKGSKWLQRVVPVDTTYGDVSGITAMLPAGDATNDNVIDIGDAGLLVSAYGDTYNVASPNANPLDFAADFNCDGIVDITDFGLLVNNYGAQGDP